MYQQAKNKYNIEFYAHFLCKSDLFFISGPGGQARLDIDIKRHQMCSKHQAKEQGHLNDKRFNHVMEKRKIDQVNSEEDKLKENTIKAEVLMCELIAELNLSMNSADTLTKAFKKMFPDSKIASNFSSGRSKTTAIINTLSMMHKDKLLLRMKKWTIFISN